MNKFRLLRADEIECRISQISDKGLSLLLYKTARTDANLLDETVGPENWECSFKEIGGVLYGGINIYDPQMDRWVEKWDCGTESNMEADKGRASDAFKRAGFKWGIGRELYTAPFIWLTPNYYDAKEGRNGKPVCTDNFRVVEIEYNEKSEVSKLTICNDKRGTDVFVWPRKRAQKAETAKDDKTHGESGEDAQGEAQPPQKAPDGEYYCDDCGELIKTVKVGGVVYRPQEVAHRSLDKHGHQYCWKCQKKRECKES